LIAYFNTSTPIENSKSTLFVPDTEKSASDSVDQVGLNIERLAELRAKQSSESYENIAGAIFDQKKSENSKAVRAYSNFNNVDGSLVREITLNEEYLGSYTEGNVMPLNLIGEDSQFEWQVKTVAEADGKINISGNIYGLDYEQPVRLTIRDNKIHGEIRVPTGFYKILSFSGRIILVKTNSSSIAELNES